jgi:hypothetical protein
MITRAGATHFVSHSDITVWFATAEPGDSIVYSVGDLAFDRRNEMSHDPKRCELDELGARMMKLARERRVYLFQRRLAVCCFEYIAMAR